ncbi:MAG: cytochrome P450, partial [Alphaproteobacteria bacterium]|nr:cytochrome P450 [Alphaproteobacteria bacterium]
AAAQELVLRLSRWRDGRVIDVQSETARVTLDILGRTIFSDGLGRDWNEFVAALSELLAAIGHLDLFDLLNLPDWVPRLSKFGGRSAERFFTKAVEDLIARRKRLLAEDRTNSPPDILTLLLNARDPDTGSKLSDNQVMSNIRTFIAAGHETTSNALTWSLFLLSQSPQWQDVLAQEASDVLAGPAENQVARLIKTRAVIEEAMRLYPPAASMSREAIGPDDLAGRRIRKGTLVIVAQWVLHRHRRLWADPDCFDPRRFLPEARDKIDRFAYLPFGAGQRICIGAAFSMQEAAIILAHLMRAFRFEHQTGHVVVPVQRITLRPADGMPLILRRRSP